MQDDPFYRVPCPEGHTWWMVLSHSGAFVAMVFFSDSLTASEERDAFLGVCERLARRQNHDLPLRLISADRY